MSAGRHSGWLGARLVGAPGLEVGAAESSQRTWRARRVRGGRWLALPVAGAVVACAAVGILLAVNPPSVTVSMSGTAYRIGDAVMREASPGVYVGDGVLVIQGDAGGVRAGSSATVAGVAWVGSCQVSAGGTRERCLLRQGTTTLTALDVWYGGSWQRTYDDGDHVAITAARGVPVPFPVGR